MKFVYNDGGRSKYFKGTAGDCATRAIAIATGMDYKEVYDGLNETLRNSSPAFVRNRRRTMTVRDGTPKEVIRMYLEKLGWKWVPTMLFGKGCKVHLTESELPKGKLIVNVSKHTTAVIDGVIYDTHDPNDRGIEVDMEGNDITTYRCVYGYFIKLEKTTSEEIIDE